MNSRYFSASRLLLLGTLVGAPMAFGAVEPWSWGAMAILTAVILLLWAAGCLSQRFLVIAPSRLYIPASLFFLFALIQLFDHLSVDEASTREAVLKLAVYLLLFFLTAQLYHGASRGAWNRLGVTVLAFASLLALFSILQLFSISGFIYWTVKLTSPGAEFGPYVDRDHYAGLMEMLIPIGATYCLTIRDRPLLLALSMSGVAIAIVSLLLTGCRGGFLGMIVELLLFAVIVATCTKERRRFRLAVASSGSIVVIAGFFFALAPSDIQGKLASIVHSTDPVIAYERPKVTVDSLHIFRDHLAVGTGLGTFEAIYPQYQSFSSKFDWDHAHDDYAEFLAETGLAGGVLATIGFLFFFRAAFFNGLRARLGDTPGWIQLGAALGCCGLLVHSFFDFNLHIPANAAWFSACAATATLKSQFPRRSRPLHVGEWLTEAQRA